MQPQAFCYIFFFSFHLYIIYAHLSEPNEKNSPPSKFLNYWNEIQNVNDHKSANELKTDSFHKHFTFFTRHPKWNKRRLRYAFNKFMSPETIPPIERAIRQWAAVTPFKFMSPETIPPIERAIRQWAAITPFKFVQVNNFSEGGSDIRISFMRGHHGDQSPFSDNELAHTFAPPDGRIHFNKDKNWVHFEADLNRSFNGEYYFDIQTVALHEFGHALGLGHSRIKEAVMYPIIEPEERKVLHKDDIEGIEALYI